MVLSDIEHESHMGPEFIDPFQLKATNFGYHVIPSIPPGTIDEGVPYISAHEDLLARCREHIPKEEGGGGFPICTRYPDDGISDESERQLNFAYDLDALFPSRHDGFYAERNPWTGYDQVAIQKGFNPVLAKLCPYIEIPYSGTVLLELIGEPNIGPRNASTLFGQKSDNPYSRPR